MESKEYKDATIKDIKEHLEYLAHYDYSKLNGIDLMVLEHILYNNIILDLEKIL